MHMSTEVEVISLTTVMSIPSFVELCSISSSKRRFHVRPKPHESPHIPRSTLDRWWIVLAGRCPRLQANLRASAVRRAPSRVACHFCPCFHLPPSYLRWHNAGPAALQWSAKPFFIPAPCPSFRCPPILSTFLIPLLLHAECSPTFVHSTVGGLNRVYTSMVKVRNHVSPFATLQTSCHHHFIVGKLVNVLSGKIHWFFSCLGRISCINIKLGLFLLEKIEDVRKLWNTAVEMVLYLSHRHTYPSSIF